MNGLQKFLLMFSFPLISLSSSNKHLSKEVYESYLTKKLSFLNEIKYVSDSISWGVEDYWQTPEETIHKKTGDCEDFSILAYDKLSKEGFPVKLCWGKLNYNSARGHFWLESNNGDKEYIIESVSNKIFNKDDINLNKKYIKEKSTQNKRKAIKDFEKRSNMKLEFKFK